MVSRSTCLLAAFLSSALAVGCSTTAKEPRSPEGASSPPPASLYNDPDGAPQHATETVDPVAVLLASQQRITSVMAQALRVGAAIWVTSHDSCPTPEDLVAAHLVSEALRSTDAWDHTFRIRCQPRGAEVTSAGPDGKFDTADDIIVGR